MISFFQPFNLELLSVTSILGIFSKLHVQLPAFLIILRFEIPFFQMQMSSLVALRLVFMCHYVLILLMVETLKQA